MRSGGVTMKCRWDVLLYAVALAVPVGVVLTRVPHATEAMARDARELVGPRPEAISGEERERQSRLVREALDALPQEEAPARARITSGVAEPEAYTNECCAPGCTHTSAGEAHAGPPRDHAATDPLPSGGMEDATWHGEYYPFTQGGEQYWVWARDICSVAEPVPMPQVGTIIKGAVASDGSEVPEHRTRNRMDRDDGGAEPATPRRPDEGEDT